MSLSSRKKRRNARAVAWADALRGAADPDELAADPVAQPTQIRWRQALVLGPLAVCAAVGAHVLFTMAVWGASELLGVDDEAPEEAEVLVVQVVEEEPPVIEAEPEPEPELEVNAEPEPVPEPKPDPSPQPKAEPPPEPDLPPPPKKIVGLDLGSTVAGGDGPSFATGSDLRGNTDSTAVDPSQAARAPEAESTDELPGTNRKATRIPQAGVKLVKPKRQTRVEPTYPPTLRAQGIEANVVVEVQIDARGNITSVKIVSPSPYEEMNEQALIAARKEKFSPATRDGEGIPFTLSYTIRFRLSES